MSHQDEMSIAARFGFGAGVFLVVAGLWGLFSLTVFSVLTTNPFLASIHLILGSLAIRGSRSQQPARYTVIMSVLVFALGALWFLPGFEPTLVTLLNLNVAGAMIHLALGIAGLTCGTASFRQAHVT